MKVVCKVCGKEEYGGVLELITNGWRTCDIENVICPDCYLEHDTDSDIKSTYNLTILKLENENGI